MKTLRVIAAMAMLIASIQASAAIACRPGLNNCPSTPGGGPLLLQVKVLQLVTN